MNPRASENKLKLPSVNKIGAILFGTALLVAATYMMLRQVGGAKTRRLEPEAHLDSGVDRFPDRALVKYARWFSIQYFNNYKIVDVINPFGAFRDTLRYLLIPRGGARPTGFERAQVVEIPIRSMVSLSTTHIGLTGFLGVNDLVVGMSDTAFILNPEVKRMVQEGKIIEVGRGDAINNELVLSLRPDLLLAVGFSGRDLSAYRTMSQSGIGVVVNSAWMEDSPLARLEWVKLLAVFLNMEGMAERKFTAIEKEYLDIRRVAEEAKHKPKVISGISRKGTWTVPGGRSIVAAFLKDAGAQYPWSEDTTTGIRQIGFEAMYPEALKADFWINPGWSKTLRKITDEDPRYGEFQAYRMGLVFNNNKRAGPNGGNEFWETGTVHPNVVLADLVKIFHPELLPEHELVYYRKLE